MSFERDVNVAVGLMFKHSKAVISRNIRSAIKNGQITLDADRVPGIELLVNRSIDEAYVQSSRELHRVFENKAQAAEEAATAAAATAAAVTKKTARK